MKIELGGPAFILTLVFIILKVTHVISWPWLWVLSPMWISLGLGLVILGIFLGFMALFAIGVGLGVVTARKKF